MVIFDTNVLNAITHTSFQQNYRVFMENLTRVLASQGTRTLETTLTPFFLLEYLGIAFKESDFPMPVFTDDLLRATQANEIIEFVSSHFKNLLQNERRLSQEFIHERYERMQIGLHTFGKSIYRDLIGRVISQEGFRDPIVESLAMDLAYGYNYNRNFGREMVQRIHVNFFLDLLSTTYTHDNTAHARGMFSVCDELRRRAPNRSFSQRIKDALSATFGLKPYKDRGDLEVIHLASVGHFSGGIRRPATIVTADPRAALERRVTTYKSLVTHMKANVSAAPNEELRNLGQAFTLAHGQILFFDASRPGDLQAFDVAQAPMVD